jgi:hypothetical protein
MMMLGLFNNAFQLYCLQGIKMVELKDLPVIFFLRFVIRCVRYNNKRNKLPPTQLVSVVPLIWQHVSTSQGHLQASSIRYTKGIVYNCIKF